MPDSVIRRVIKVTALAVFVLSVEWAVVLILSGGFDTEVFGRRLSSNAPLRPLLIASLALSVLILAGGIRATPQRAVMVIALLMALTGVLFGTTAAGGADSYGYVSQADLWNTGTLKVSQPWVADVPWPNREWTFAPLGYRPSGQGRVGELVPTYSPGLPLLMALAKRAAGHCAMFLIVPVSGAVLVLATYGVGTRLGSPLAGLIGALLVATSPPVLLMLMSALTDVPVAAAWAASFYFLLGTTRRSIVASGLLAAVAILIRPNLVILAPAMALWYLIRTRSSPLRDRLGDLVLFSLAAAPGVITTALINNYLYGSPLTSGYGGLRDMFSSDYVLPNLVNYSRWLVEAQTVAFVAGILALAIPMRAIWPNVGNRRVFFIIALFIALLWMQYFAYLVFDVWWYLRFLLSSWPFIAVGVGALIVATVRSRGRVAMALGVLLVSGVVIHNLWFAWRHGAFDSWQGERRYVSIGKHVRTWTPENSVIFTMQHSGSLRYYSGRVTLRYDNLDRRWLDRAVAFLEERGTPPFLLLEEWEVPDFKQRFGSQAALERLARPPVFTYRGPAEIRLWDLRSTRSHEDRSEMIVESYRQLSCVPPAPSRPLIFHAVGRSFDD
jgi:hypothetical protein